MTIQQLTYIIAVDRWRHFSKAAEVCRVTQPTLSMMIRKLEDELEVKIFDRTALPVVPTPIGREIIEQAHTAVYQFERIRELTEDGKGAVKGDFHMGVIPTVATYMVPELLRTATGTDADIRLLMQEIPTPTMVEWLLNGKIDGGLAATPLNHPLLLELPLYYERFYAYVAADDPLFDGEEIDLEAVDVDKLWLLDNIHCLRGQVETLCRRKRERTQERPAAYVAGSLETLINIVDYNGGFTVIPEMTAMGLPEEKQNNLRRIRGEIAVREISLVVSRRFVRQKMAAAVAERIKATAPKSMQDPALRHHVIAVRT